MRVSTFDKGMNFMRRNLFSIFKSKFTLKIIALTIAPIFFLSLFSVVVLFQKINELNKSATQISTSTMHVIYEDMITDKNRDIKEKIALRLDDVLHELNMLRAEAQRLIDKNETSFLERKLEYDPWVKKNMVYMKANIRAGIG